MSKFKINMNYLILQNFIQLSYTIVSNSELIQGSLQIHKGKQEIDAQPS